MPSLNKVILIGNLGADVEFKSFDNGGKLAKLRIATSKRWKDKSGEYVEKTEWHNIVVRGSEKMVDYTSKFKKGDCVYIEGELSTRNYEHQGQKRYETEVVVGFEGTIRGFILKSLHSNSYNDEQPSLPSNLKSPKPETAEWYKAQVDAERRRKTITPTASVNDEIPF